eukprot:749440-Hanusia_phi.AAC.1
MCFVTEQHNYRRLLAPLGELGGAFSTACHADRSFSRFAGKFRPCRSGISSVRLCATRSAADCLERERVSCVRGGVCEAISADADVSPGRGASVCLLARAGRCARLEEQPLRSCTAAPGGRSQLKLAIQGCDCNKILEIARQCCLQDAVSYPRWLLRS